jgi:hypothetical protein
MIMSLVNVLDPSVFTRAIARVAANALDEHQVVFICEQLAAGRVLGNKEQTREQAATAYKAVKRILFHLSGSGPLWLLASVWAPHLVHSQTRYQEPFFFSTRATSVQAQKQQRILLGFP